MGGWEPVYYRFYLHYNYGQLVELIYIQIKNKKYFIFYQGRG